jgi:transcription elongation factor GreA
MDKLPMTKEGVVALEVEQRYLKEEERPAIIHAIAVAREHGDLKENAEYHAARERQSFVEGRLAELKSIISLAQIIDPSMLSGDVVRFGATLELANEETDTMSTYQIVGTHEADINNGRLSVTAPLARALIGKSVGDSVEVVSPGGAKFYEIIKVDYK